MTPTPYRIKVKVALQHMYTMRHMIDTIHFLCIHSNFSVQIGVSDVSLNIYAVHSRSFYTQLKCIYFKESIDFMTLLFGTYTAWSLDPSGCALSLFYAIYAYKKRL